MSALAAHASTGVVVANDGSHLLVRRIWPGDTAALRRMHARLSPDSIYRRFMVACPREPSPALLRYLAVVDHRSREALVALHNREIVAVARYHALGNDDAEIAVLVEDAWQRNGVARHLVTDLTALAKKQGIKTFSGSMLADNGPAVALLKSLFPTVQIRIENGEIDFRIPLTTRALELI